jgi:hypothetical protein
MEEQGLIEQMERALAPPFLCGRGGELAVADANHDFNNIDLNVVIGTLPQCASGSRTVLKEEKELVKILEYVLGTTLSSETKTVLTAKGDNLTNTLPSPLPGWDTNRRVAPVFIASQNSQYIAYDLGGLGWDSSMSTINRKISKISKKFSRTKGSKNTLPVQSNTPIPILEQVIRSVIPGVKQVYIIDDIHSTAFVENIKARVGSGTDPFWCYMQTPQTIFDPAGKISPQTKPDIFSPGSNVEYGWYDFRSPQRRGAPIIPGEIGMATIMYPAPPQSLRADEEITESKQKLMTRNDVYLTIKGEIDDPTTHIVNFFTKVDEGSYAVFDNKSSAINNRNYMSSKIVDYIGKYTDKLSRAIGMKTHFIAKRFGDQGQAEVGCEDSIPCIKERSGTRTVGTTNGNHLFVSKDRLAVGAGLMFGTPMILHIKSGTPKDKLHNILYIRRDLMSVRPEDVDAIVTEAILLNEKITTINTSVSVLNIFCQGEIEKFAGIFISDPLTDRIDIIKYIKTVETNIQPYIICKNTQAVLDGDLPLIEFPDIGNGLVDWLSSFVTSQDKLRASRLSKLVSDINKTKNIIFEIETIMQKQEQIRKDGIVNLDISTDAPTQGRRTRRSRAAMPPSTMADLRKMWKPIATKLYSYEQDDSFMEAFTVQCVARSDIPGEPAALIEILGKSAPEIIRSGGFAPTVTETMVIERSFKRDRDEYEPEPEKFPGEGRVLNMSPVDVIRSAGIVPDPSPSAWYKNLDVNRYGQIISPRLLTLRFARAMLILMYDLPELLLKDWGQMENIISAYVKADGGAGTGSGGGGGFAPPSPPTSPEEAEDQLEDASELDDQLHTEIDYLYTCYRKSTYVSDAFNSDILRILWYVQSVKDTSKKFTKQYNVYEQAGILTPAEDSVDERKLDLDPLIAVNEFARAILGGDTGGMYDANNGPIDNDDASIRIIFTKDGYINRNCGFYKNCVKSTLDEVVAKMNLRAQVEKSIKRNRK